MTGQALTTHTANMPVGSVRDKSTSDLTKAIRSPVHSEECQVVGCSRKKHAKGLCGAHYRRMRKHGSPEGGRTPNGSGADWILKVAVTASQNDCLIWPFRAEADGYARIWSDGRYQFVHRLVCEHVHGPAPSSSYQAAHSCGNGAGGCVNPDHLRWATPEENQADRIQHGTANAGQNNGRAKLTEGDVGRIICLRGKLSQSDIAQKFGVSQATISKILRGEAWGYMANE